jgi:hypothetical protein
MKKQTKTLSYFTNLSGLFIYIPTLYNEALLKEYPGLAEVLSKMANQNVLVRYHYQVDVSSLDHLQNLCCTLGIQLKPFDGFRSDY